jgi:hypothetical protein
MPEEVPPLVAESAPELASAELAAGSGMILAARRG